MLTEQTAQDFYNRINRDEMNLQANHSTVLATCFKATPEELFGYEPTLLKTDKQRAVTPAGICSNGNGDPWALLPPVCDDGGKLTYL